MSNAEQSVQKSVGGLRGIEINGYKPFGFLNLALGVASGLGLGYGALSIGGDTEAGIIGIIVGLVFFALVLLRNRKLNDVPKMIGFSVITSVLGILLVVIGILKAFSAGMRMANKMS